mmetsp:Transcript_53964/g.61797  ORF Transcript_53964/g.61797 Transcript_53964/m.61797 type:complete len:258 (-) Transcript_53964:307-1080(-)|eukprot:CAMPEP_0115026524 /NCGR_PEP_ID=MMETSP0216-20121206/34815_1 /TAXON_ID=223996 /ORGANISM="Protocruzia adherens, Strain Boccale" /LENGTH=257 /DNA_ID=CAMNT_0002401651 /DNA_START=15 /DNA_END=788 /DNA_ORIENTATION=+
MKFNSLVIASVLLITLTILPAANGVQSFLQRKNNLKNHPPSQYERFSEYYKIDVSDEELKMKINQACVKTNPDHTHAMIMLIHEGATDEVPCFKLDNTGKKFQIKRVPEDKAFQCSCTNSADQSLTYFKTNYNHAYKKKILRRVVNYVKHTPYKEYDLHKENCVGFVAYVWKNFFDSRAVKTDIEVGGGEALCDKCDKKIPLETAEWTRFHNFVMNSFVDRFQDDPTVELGKSKKQTEEVLGTNLTWTAPMSGIEAV